MGEPDTFLTRIGRLFGAKPRRNGEGPMATLEEGSEPVSVEVQTNAASIRPWRRNSAAIAQLQGGFNSLTELMGEIRQNLVAQGRRQDELLQHLAALPKVLESIPENSRLQGESLKAIHAQLVHHGEAQQTLGEILEKLAEGGTDQKDLLEGLRERMETLNHQDKAMADSLNSVGAALESTSRHSATSAKVLENIQDNLRSRDGDLERVLKHQSAKFTTLLVIAICISVIALGAVVAMGYLMMHSGAVK